MRESKRPKSARSKKIRPNRIYELTKERHWTYPEVAERVREIAMRRGDAAHTKVHTVTINRLSTGEAKLTQEWMTLLGEVFGVPPSEIISAPVAQNLRRVTVVCALQANQWRQRGNLPTNEQYDIMVPNDLALHGVNLYAGEIRGPENNLRYAPGSVVVISELEGRPDDLKEGKRYHVRVSRTDGMIEESIRLLHIGPEGQYWLKPESSHPQHQEWIPLVGRPGYKVEIIGRVRGVFFREED